MLITYQLNIYMKILRILTLIINITLFKDIFLKIDSRFELFTKYFSLNNVRMIGINLIELII
jgi:hypothetical protein